MGSEDADGTEEGGVVGGFFVEGEWIGAGGGRHAPYAQGAPEVGGAGVFAHAGREAVGEAGEDRRGLLAGGGEVAAVGQRGKEGGKVDGFHDFEILVGSVALKAAYAAAGVVQGYVAVGEQPAYGIDVEAPGAGQAERRGVAAEEQSADAPEVIGGVGIVEIHSPALRGGRECAHDEHTGSGGGERRPGMRLYGQVISHNYRKRSKFLRSRNKTFIFDAKLISKIVFLIILITQKH